MRKPCEVVDLGIDYLSFTMEHDNIFLADMKAMFDAGQMKAHDAGEKCHNIAPAGYKGVRCGKYFYGEYKGLTLFQVSSSEAHTVAMEVKNRGIELRTTRIDFQATYKRTEEHTAFAQRLRSGKEKADRKADRKKRTLSTLVESGGSGDSVTFGSRNSGRTFISYDKTAQSAGQLTEPLLRDEVRFHREQAKQVWREVLKTSNVETLIVALLVAYLRSKGIDRTYSVAAPDMRLPSSKHISDEERTVKWLITLVAPAVDRIVDKRNLQLVADAFGTTISPTREASRSLTALERETIWQIQERNRSGQQWESSE